MFISTLFLLYIWYDKFMKVKIFDEGHEKDLERDINSFINEEIDVVDIQFRTAVSIYSNEQIYCFSALILYKEK